MNTGKCTATKIEELPGRKNVPSKAMEIHANNSRTALKPDQKTINSRITIPDPTNI